MAPVRIYTPFLWGSGMSKWSEHLRSKAARELRRSRNGGTPDEKADSRKRAAALKSLAENEQWLEGESQRPRRADEQKPLDKE